MPIAIALTLLFLLAVPAAAQDARTFGTTSLVSHTLHASAFTGATAADNAAIDDDDDGDRYCLGTDRCVLRAPLMLPTGALVSVLELEACDTSGTGSVRADFVRRRGENSLTASTSTGAPTATPGCQRFDLNFTPLAETIDNLNSVYFVNLVFSSTVVLTAATQVRAVRLFYQLQVSPAPAVATFDDVPTTHPFFPFIEALVAAGITTGCSTTPPLYCPDGFVTRKQMAAFFARALGLHWAP